MRTQKQTSAGVIAAAIVAIAGSVLAIAFGVLVQVTSRIGPSAHRGPMTSDAAQTLALGRVVWLFIIVVAVFGVLTGVELISGKNWARVTILVWSGLQAGFSLLAMVATFAVFRVMPAPPNVPEHELRTMGLIIPLVYLIPLGIGIWWLVLFTRKSVAAQFAGESFAVGTAAAAAYVGYPAVPVAGAVAPSARPAKPTCPIPVVIVAGFMAFSAVSSLFVFLTPKHVPPVFFGHVFQSPAMGHLLFVALGALHLLASIGILRLKPSGYSLGVGLQIFGLANILANLVTPGLEEVMREAMSPAHLAPGTAMPFDPMRFFYAILVATALFSGVILAILLTYRARFLEAAEQAAEANQSG